MLRTFAASLLTIAAMGRGNGNGYLRENSFETVLVDDNNVTMTLFIYNKNNEKGGPDEFHGDVHIVTKPDVSITNYIEFGWCAKFETGDRWDCQRIRPGRSLQPPADPNDAVAQKFYQGTYELVDGYYNSDPQDFRTAMTFDAQSNIVDDPALNWKHDPERSNTDCVDPWDSDFDIVQCSEINSHFLRNFVTT